MTRQRRLAGIGLVVVFLAISGFALWCSQALGPFTDAVRQTSRVADDYAAVDQALLEEESLQLQYRAQPASSVRAEFETVAHELDDALAAVARDGGAPDQAESKAALADHAALRAAIQRLFAAVDRRDATGAEQIETAEVQPRLDAITRRIADRAAQRQADATTALRRLDSVQSFRALAIRAVIGVGLALVLAFGLLLRRSQLALDAERTAAIHASLHDTLTGLPNRTLFAGRTDEILTGAPQPGAAVLVLDLDRFKDINATLGHGYGDRLLVLIGPRLQAALPADAVVARLGGDEFAVLLPSAISLTAALEQAERLLTALSAAFAVDGVELDVDASIGVALATVHGSDAATLLQHADVAMYVAKEQGIGVCAYDPATDGHTPQRLALLGELRRALERGELTLHYQPKVSFRTEGAVGAEALVRWEHPVHGLLAPDEFIPLAEHTGLIGPLTRYVLDHALGQMRAWADIGLVVPVAVNISARNLLDERLPDLIVELLERHGVPAAQLEIEVTESAIMTEPARAQQSLTRLKELGIGIAIDDFGAGYTSLSQLKSLPVSDVKIDRSLIGQMDNDPGMAQIVRSVVELGHHLGLISIAEGVETQQSWDLLNGFGCDIAQGFHLSRPLTPAAFHTWYTTQNPPPASQ